jgi:hypothetical protein
MIVLLNHVKMVDNVLLQMKLIYFIHVDVKIVGVVKTVKFYTIQPITTTVISL